MARSKMPVRRPFQLRLPSWLAGLIYLLALRFAFEGRNEPYVWQIALGVIGVTAFLAWISAYLRYRALADIPLADIVSAPQGYVKFTGTARGSTDTLILSELKQRPCIWFDYCVEDKYDGKWRISDSGQSQAPILLDDGTGLCMLDPQQAELDMGRHREEWKSPSESTRYTESYVLAGDALYAIGEHITERSLKNDPTKTPEMNKQNQDLHIMRPPADGRVFRISATPPALDAKKYAQLAWIHLAILFLCVGGQGYLWLRQVIVQ